MAARTTTNGLTKTLLTPLVATLLGGPAPSKADQPVIDEIQVTATRRATSIRDVSVGLTRVDGEDIAGEPLVTDALAFEPGTYRQQTTPGQGAIIIRGLKGSEVLHLVDGVRLNNAMFRNAPTQYFALVPVAAVERIEVIRGAATSLYGSDAVGGVVNVVSRLPAFDGAERGWAGSFAVGADTAELARSASVTVETGSRELAALASLEYTDLGHRRIGGGGRIDPSAWRSRAARLAVVATPDDSRRWLADFQYLVQPSTPRVDELIPGFGEDEAASAEFWFEPNRRRFVHLQHSRSDGWLATDWVIDLAWQRIDDDRRNRDTGSTERRLERNRSDLFELSLNGARDESWGSWAYGVEWYHDRVRSSRNTVDILSGAGASIEPRFPDGSTVDQIALYAHAIHNLGERHRLIAGLRATDVKVDLAASASAPAARVDTDDLSGELGWVSDLTGELQLVANASRSFRAPNVFDLGTLGARPGNRFNIANPDLEPERARQLDAGLRYTGERWRAEVMAYVLDYSDRITSVLTGDVTPEGRLVVQNRNIADARIHGLEAGADVAVGERSRLRLVVNYTRGLEDDATGDEVPADRIPPLNGALAVSHELRASLELEARLEFAAGQDRLSPRDLRDARIDPGGTPGWATIGLAARRESRGGIRTELGVDNLLDRRYRIHGSGVDAPGRNVWLRVEKRW